MLSHRSIRNYDVYAAGPFFDNDQIKSMERMEGVLYKHYLRPFVPRKQEANKREPLDPTAIYVGDVVGIRCSKVAIANLTYQDTGTACELVHNAQALKSATYGFIDTDMLRGRRAKVNIMILGYLGSWCPDDEPVDSLVQYTQSVTDLDSHETLSHDHKDRLLWTSLAHHLIIGLDDLDYRLAHNYELLRSEMEQVELIKQVVDPF